jgi:hypothetical protein
MPDDARNTQLEIVGYFPLPPSAQWEFDSEESWPEFQRTLKQNLADDFRLVFATNGRLHFRRNWPGMIEHLQIEIVSDAQPMRVRCGYMQIHDPYGE